MEKREKIPFIVYRLDGEGLRMKKRASRKSISISMILLFNENLVPTPMVREALVVDPRLCN